jgi:uncharacterized membrane protein YphA (DoxX/SURF4 family)
MAGVVIGKPTHSESCFTMKKVLDNSYFILAARSFVGILFIIASIDKIADPTAFAASVGNYKIVSGSLLLILATILPWIELLAGLFLLLGIFRHGSALLLSTLLCIFTLAVISALVRGLDITCGCFTQDPAASKVGWLKVAENAGLLFLGLFSFLGTNDALSLQAYLNRKGSSSSQGTR